MNSPPKTRLLGQVISIASNGHGIIKHEGLVIFVPYTAIGDEVEIEIIKNKGSFAFGEVTQILSESKRRTTPPCPYFHRCGGCQFQHIQYSEQVNCKQSFVSDALNRIGKIACTEAPKVHPASQIYHYRRHIRLKLKKGDAGYEMGYTADNGQFLKVSSCLLFLPDSFLFDELAPLIHELEGNDEASLRIVKNEGRFFLFFDFAQKMPVNSRQVGALCMQLTQIEGVIFKDKKRSIHLGATEGFFSLLGLQIHFSPEVFLQNHPQESAHIYEQIAKLAQESQAKRALDLYCGIGISSLLLSDWMQVTGIESNPLAIVEANKNKLANGKQLKFIQADVAAVLARQLKEQKPDLIVVNPPRVGLMPVVRELLLQSNVKHLIYISCQPATLARDLKPFYEQGYETAFLEAYDMFPQTKHVETVVYLKRSQAKLIANSPQ